MTDTSGAWDVTLRFRLIELDSNAEEDEVRHTISELLNPNGTGYDYGWIEEIYEIIRITAEQLNVEEGVIN